MKTSLFALASFLFILASASESAAGILYGKDNDANQTDPGTGVPWANVARVTNSAGTAVNASAVYLGDRFMLTADHVSVQTHVTFDGGTTWAVESGSAQQVAPGVDLKIFRLAEDPGLPSVMLYEEFMGNADLSQPSTLVGWGRGRDPNVEPNTASVPWGTNATIAKRWGTNTTLSTAVTANYDYNGNDYNYTALQTRLDSNAGADEIGLTLYDSGGALFQEIGGAWYLSGIAATVSRDGESRFGLSAGANAGDSNYFVRLAAYSDEINAVIPEPSTWAAVAGFLALGFAVRRRVADKG